MTVARGGALSRAARRGATAGCCSCSHAAAVGGGSGRGRPGAGHHRRALRALRAARAVPAGGGGAGPVLQQPARPADWRPWACGTVPSSTPTGSSRVLRAWIDWNYTGLEGEGAVAGMGGGDFAPARGSGRASARGGRRVQPGAREGRLDPHVRDAAVLLRAAPRSRASTTRPACRRTPSTTSRRSWPSVSPNPVPQPRVLALRHARRGLAPPAALQRGEVVAAQRRSSPPRSTRAAASVERVARIPPYTAVPARGPRPRLRGAAGLRARALAARAAGATRRTAGSRASRSRSAPLVFTDDPRFDVAEADEWLAAAGGAAAGRSVHVRAEVGRRGDHIHDRAGRPPAAGQGLLPPALARRGRRRAVPGVAGPHDGGAAPQPEVRLFYAGAHVVRSRRPRARRGGCRPSSLGGTVARRRRAAALPAGGSPARGLVALPIALLVALAALRLVPRPSFSAEVDRLYERASRAYAAERWEEAAEFARHAVSARPPGDSPAGRAAVRPGARRSSGPGMPGSGRGIHARGGGRGGAPPPGPALGSPSPGGGGRPDGAAAWRGRLRDEFPETPWARPLP